MCFFGCYISKGSPYQKLSRDHNICRCAVRRPEKVSPYTDFVLSYLCVLVLWGFRIHDYLKSRVALNPGLGGVRDVSSSIIQMNSFSLYFTMKVVIISHEQIQ